jgi:hypothetical protein
VDKFTFVFEQPTEVKLEHRFEDIDEEESEAMMESLWEPKLESS